MSKKIGSLRRNDRERFWRKVVSGQPRSGMSVAAWCGKHGVSAPSFYVWRQRLAKCDATRKVHRLPLLPVEILSLARGKSIVSLEIELPSQVKVRVRSGCDLDQLQRVLRMLGQDRPEAERC